MWAPELVHWPAEHQRRARLAEAGIPRVLVIAAGETVPADIGTDEDWLQSPVSEQDVAAHLEHLRLRLERTTQLQGRVLTSHRGTVTLTRREAAVMEILLNQQGRLASRQALLACLGVERGAGRRLHDVVYRLRTQIRPFGLDVLSTRGSGYMLRPRIDTTPED